MDPMATRKKAKAATRENFARRLTGWMNLRGLRADELAVKAGVGTVTVHKWRSGAFIPQRETEEIVLAILGCSRAEFYDGAIPDASPPPRRARRRKVRQPQVDIAADGTIRPREPRSSQAAS